MRLQEELDGTNTHDMLLVTGDMNAKVGDEIQNYGRLMGKHSLGVRNDTGDRLRGLVT